MFSKKHSFFIIFSNFSNFKIFWFLPKNFIIKAETIFLRKTIPIDTQSTVTFPPLAILKNSSFSRKKIHLFFQKNPNFDRFENLTVSVAFYSKCFTIWWKTWINVNAIGKHRVEKRSLWLDDFPPILYIYIWRKIIKLFLFFPTEALIVDWTPNSILFYFEKISYIRIFRVQKRKVILFILQ